MSDMIQFPRKADHPIARQFLERWSPRAFAPEAMTEAAKLTLQEAARWAPSASNNQPWRLVWALRGEAAFDEIIGSLNASNAVWAGKAAAVVVMASRVVVQRGDEVLPNPYHAFDAGAAWAQLGLQAHLMGLHAHAMGGYDRDLLTKAINLPQDHVTHAVVAVGKRAALQDIPEELRAREVPNQRQTLSETTRHGKF